MTETDPGGRQLARPLALAEGRALTRRELVRRGGGAAMLLCGGPALLAACGGGGGGSEAAATTGGTQTGGSISGTIDFFSWEGYDLPDKYFPTMKAWKQDNNVQIRASYIGSHDDIQAKIKSGGGEGIDLITYGQQYKPLYSKDQLNILSPLNPDELPNLKNLFPFFASDVGNYWVDADGTRTGVPTFWLALALTYDSAEFSSAPTTYDVLLDPKYKGKVTVVDAATDVFGTASVALGLDFAKMSEDDFSKLVDWTKQVVAQTNGLATAYGDMATRLASGDAVLAFPGWAAVNQYSADAGKKTIKWTLPEQGGFGAVDAYAIPVTADNPSTAHAWINEAITPEVNAEAANYLFGGTVCSGSVPLLNKEIAAIYPYDDLESFFAKAKLIELPPAESDTYVTLDTVQSAWQEVKAAA
jgi:spermidine/putrescine transport system substrate-binding protein